MLFATNTRVIDRLDHDPEHVLVTNNERNKFYPDVYRLNVYDGKMTRVETNPGHIQGSVTPKEMSNQPQTSRRLAAPKGGHL